MPRPIRPTPPVPLPMANILREEIERSQLSPEKKARLEDAREALARLERRARADELDRVARLGELLLSDDGPEL